MYAPRIIAPYPEWRGRHLWIGSLWVGEVLHWTRSTPSWWRAWALISEDGKEVGRCATEEEAKEAVIAAVLNAICLGRDHS